MTPGYSGTSLAKKLGIKAGTRVLSLSEPADYMTWLAPLPEGVAFGAGVGEADIIHLFVVDRAVLAENLNAFRHQMKPGAFIWVSWPKKASKVPTDITEDTIRDVCLPIGLVDIKVCAVSDIWSGLKLVIRKALR
jgi:hypothetical protein